MIISIHQRLVTVASSLISHLRESLKNIISNQAPPKPPESLLTNLQEAYARLVALAHEHFSDLLSTQPKATPPDGLLSQSYANIHSTLLRLQSIEPTLVAATILTLILLFRLSMSWSSRFPGWSTGRFSPFTRSSPKGNGEISDSDFSYITAEDLARSQAEQASRDASFVPSHNRDTDVLILKHKRVSYPVHFPAHSIDRGELRIADLRAAAAKRLNIPPSESDRIKIFYRGKNLKDDYRTAREEGLRSDAESELMLVVGEATPRGESSSEDGEEEDTASAPEGGKKKRNRRKKNKSKKKSGTDTPTSNASSSHLNPDATYAPSTAPPPPRKPSPQPAAAALTPLQKLDALASNFHTKLVPECVQFISNPPSDKAKRDFDHKKLTETILAQVVLKLDAVETEGNPEARQRRKDLVKEAQNMMNKLDEVVK